MLIWLLRVLVWWPDCRHHWLVEDQGPYVERQREEWVRVGTYYDLRCAKCGEMARRKLTC